MPSLSRSFGKYLYDQIKTASAAPLLLVASAFVVWFIFVPYSAHARTRTCNYLESVLILSILGLMKLHVDIHVIHALSLKMNLILLACIAAWLG